MIIGLEYQNNPFTAADTTIDKVLCGSSVIFVCFSDGSILSVAPNDQDEGRTLRYMACDSDHNLIHLTQRS